MVECKAQCKPFLTNTTIPIAAANTADTAALIVNERILQECHKLYVDEEQLGLAYCLNELYSIETLHGLTLYQCPENDIIVGFWRKPG